MESIFLDKASEYVRDVNPIQQSIDQASLYLSKMRNISVEEARSWYVNKLKRKEFPNVRDPVVISNVKNSVGDMVVTEEKLTSVLKTITKERLIVSPSFTCYSHPDDKECILSDMLVNNVKKRSVAKELSKMHKAKEDVFLATSKNEEQALMKNYNNSVSGSLVTYSSTFVNKTAHSTLTSTTRTITSLGNAVNEKMVVGRRHYSTKDIVLWNIISTIGNTNQSKFLSVINKYNLHYPTVEETMECIKHSSMVYFRGAVNYDPISELVNKLSTIDRAIFVYQGDLHHTKKYNDKLLRKIVGELIKVVSDVEYNDPIKIVKNINSVYLNMAHHSCTDLIGGCGVDYVKMHEKGVLNTIVATSLHIEKIFLKYKDLLTTLFKTKNMPSDVANIKNVMRDAVVLSDTDSTCVSYQDWVKWYFGSIIFTPEAIAVVGAIMTIGTQVIAHTLAICSGNMNIVEENIFTLTMKNEFYWDIMIPMNVSKHYVALTRINEGNVYLKPELEVKGVHLKTSNAPIKIKEGTTKMIVGIMDDISKNKSISMYKLLTEVADVERIIEKSLNNNEREYYRLLNIKDTAGYKKDEFNSPYNSYHMWNEIFREEYGSVDKPPYNAIAIKINIRNKTQMNNWIDSIETVSVKNGFRRWLTKTNKNRMGTITLPMSIVISGGIPKELYGIINSEEIIQNINNMYYMLLSSLGWHNKKGQTLMKQGY